MDISDKSTMELLANDIITGIKDMFPNISVSIGLSTADHVIDFHAKYLEACAALQLRNKQYDADIFFFESLLSENGQSVCYSTSDEQKLFSALRSCDVTKAQNLIRDFLLGIQHQSPEITLLYIIGIINSVDRLRKDLNLPADHQEVLLISLLKNGQTTYHQAIDYLCSIVESVCAAISASQDTKKEKRLDNILEIIQSKYTDATFCLNDIAALLNTSPSNVVTIFKNQMNTTPMHYVDTLRMTKASFLLKTTDLPIREIILQVGYTDQTNFIRKFKTVYGVTPSTYRKVLEETEEN